MVIYVDEVEELCSFGDLSEGFVGFLEDSASELDLTFHTSATRGTGVAISAMTFSTFI